MTVPFIYNFRSLSNKCPTILCLIFPSPGLAISLAAVIVIYGVRRMGWRGANSHAIKNNSASNAGYAILINAN